MTPSTSKVGATMTLGVTTLRRLERIAVVLVATAGAAMPSRGDNVPRTTPRIAIEQLQAQLHRGVSTRADVERMLGAPTGAGGAELPGDSIRRGVWYYGDIEVTNERPDLWSEPERVVVATKAQRTLLIFFDDDIYSGFIWIRYPAAP